MSSVIPIWGNNPKEAFFRRKFQLPERFARAVVRIFVDTGFELFLNERLVAVVDEWNNQRDYDVTPFLRGGENLAAVHGVNHSGHRGFSFELTAYLCWCPTTPGLWRTGKCGISSG